MTMQLMAIACALALTAGFGSGWKIHAWKTDAAIAHQMQEQEKAYKKKLSATEALLSKVTAQKQKTRTIYREVRHEVQNTKLGTCDLSADALSLLADAAVVGTASTEAGKPDGTVPDATKPKVR